MLNRLRVELGPRSYDIVLTDGGLGGIGQALVPLGFGGRIALVSNPTVYGLYGGRVRESLEKAGFEVREALIPDGEEYKSLEWAEKVLGELLGARLDRGACIVALGGGVIGDLGGFVASLYMRGISFVQAPTTLLAQVDSSVGGKTGVNHALGKNLIGSFWQPSLVWIDVSTLHTLPRRELLSGMAEVIKYGVIWDEEFLAYLEDSRDRILALDPQALLRVIGRSCQIKAEVVSRDEREGGLRAILNFGHTIGHAVESATGYVRYLHGEGVSIGMCAEAELAAMLGIASPESPARIREICRLYGLPTEMPGDIPAGDILSAMKLDKKVLRDEIRFVLPERIGRVRINEPVGRADIEKFLGWATT